MEQKTNPEYLKMWTVYFNPADYPGKYVARLFHNDQPQESVIVSEHLIIVRSHMRELRLYRLGRQEGDEPHIIETWL